MSMSTINDNQSLTLHLSLEHPGRECPQYQPTWFMKELDATTGSLIYTYNKQYWKCKACQDWSSCPDIFL